MLEKSELKEIAQFVRNLGYVARIDENDIGVVVSAKNGNEDQAWLEPTTVQSVEEARELLA